jgi:hypothetical protein
MLKIWLCLPSSSSPSALTLSSCETLSLAACTVPTGTGYAMHSSSSPSALTPSSWETQSLAACTVPTGTGCAMHSSSLPSALTPSSWETQSLASCTVPTGTGYACTVQAHPVHWPPLHARPRAWLHVQSLQVRTVGSSDFDIFLEIQFSSFLVWP